MRENALEMNIWKPRQELTFHLYSSNLTRPIFLLENYDVNEIAEGK